MNEYRGLKIPEYIEMINDEILVKKEITKNDCETLPEYALIGKKTGTNELFTINDLTDGRVLLLNAVFEGEEDKLKAPVEFLDYAIEELEVEEMKIFHTNGSAGKQMIALGLTQKKKMA